MQKPNAGASLPKRKTTPCSLVGAYVIPRTVICLPTSSSLLIAGVPRYNVLSFHNSMLTGTQVLRARPDECNGDVSTTISHRSGTYSCPARKLPVLRGHFHLFPLFDEEGNPDFQARLQSGSLGPAARRVAPNRRFRVGNVQLNEYWQLYTNRIAV